MRMAEAPSWIGRWRERRRLKRANEVVFHTFPKLIFVWPIIAAGFLFWPLATAGVSPEVLGWSYLLIVGLVILTIGIDIERNYAVFWFVVALALFFLGKWLSQYDAFTLFGDAYTWFANLDVDYDRSLGLCLSIFLAVPFIVMLLWSRLQHRWRITHNEFEHYAFGRADDSLARGAKRVRSTYPDLLEFLICGAGTLIVYSATGRTELRRIPHVPLIFLVRRRINKLLEYTAVVVGSDNAVAEALEEEETEAEEAERGAGEGPLGGDRRDDDYDEGRAIGDAKEPL